MSAQMSIRFAEGNRIIADYDGFEIATDQSEKSGGAASAPEPFDLFLASLGCCSGLYVRAFCEKRDLPFERIGITQRWERDDKKRLAKIIIELALPADFPDKYRDSVVRAANLCTVKKTILDPPEMTVTVV